GGEILHELRLPLRVVTVRWLGLVLAIAFVNERLGNDALHGQEGVAPRLAHGVFERAQIAVHGQSGARQKLKRALRVAAARRGERRAVMQLGTRRVVAYDVEADIAGAD